jgi:hypothetical protein
MWTCHSEMVVMEVWSFSEVTTFFWSWPDIEGSTD